MSRKYERNACFYLWVYKRDLEKPSLHPIPKNVPIELPLSQKSYKVTLRNLKIYLSELLESDPSILKIEIERATHVGSYSRKGDTY